MNKFFLVFFFFLFSLKSFSQQVFVVDENMKPIEHVVIYNDFHSVFTNFMGKADVSEFVDNKIIIFKHTSYKDIHISYEEIKNNNFTVKLTESTLNLNEVVISANSWEQNKNEVPNRINVISKKVIAFNNSQTTADLLKTSGEVFIQKSQLGGGSPMIRGFSANRVLLVVDGVRMNNAIFRSGNLQNVISLDANCIENSEIIFGPGSVVYGSDALGGVMDFHTLKPSFSKHDSLKFSGNAMMRFSSANNEKTGHIDFNISRKKISSITSFSYSNFDDLKMGNIGNEEYKRTEYVETTEGIDVVVKNTNGNIQKFSGYNQINLMQKVSFKPTKFWNLTYGFHYSKTSNVPRYDRLLQYSKGKLKYAEWFYGPQQWMMNNFTFKKTKETVLFSKAKLVLAQQDYSESRHDRKFGNAEIRKRYENVKAFSANLDFEKKLKNKLYLFYGTEFVLNKVYSTGKKVNINDGTETIVASRYPNNSTYSSFASYISFKKNITKKITFSSGIRYNRIYAYAKLDTVFYDFPFQAIDLNLGAFNGSAGFVFRPDTWQISVNLSSGFRAPNIDDMAKVFDSEPGSVIVPNDDLKPELAYNTDFGIVKIINNKIKIDVTVFYTFLNNTLIRKDFTFNGQDSILYDAEMSKVQAIVNADNAIIYGFQISLKAELIDNLNLSSNYTFTKGFDSENKPLRHVAPAFGITHLIFQKNRFKFDLYSEYNTQISADNLAESEKNKKYMYAIDNKGYPYSPSWCTFNINSSWKINKTFTIKAAVENILDYRYRPYSSGIVAAGRNFVFSLRLNF